MEKEYAPFLVENKDVNYKVPILEKGIALLEHLSLHPRGETLLDIKNELDISQTTLYRLLNTLVRLGYLRYEDENKHYALTCKLLTLGFRALSEHRIMELVLPHLHTLRNKVKETTCFGILGAEKGLLIDQALGTHTFSFTMSPGMSFELHSSAPGKAIMAYLPDAVREEYLCKMTFKRYNERTITSRAVYLQELERVKRDGYALDREEEFTGVYCIAAPVLNHSGYPCGSIWISGPKERFPEDVIAADAAIVSAYAGELSARLGYSQT